MQYRYWKYLALALIAGNLIYWLIIAPVRSWQKMVERNLAGIGRIIAVEHPEQVQQRQPPPPTEEESQ